MSLSRFRCKVKFLSTLSIFPHQSDCQNISSPLHLSVLEHLSIVLSYLFYIAVSHLYIQHLNWIIGLTSKNSTTLLSTNIINNWRHALKTTKIKVYRWSWLLSHANSYWNLCQAQEQWLLPILWSLKCETKKGYILVHLSCYLSTLKQLVSFRSLNEVASCHHSLLIV